MMIQLTTQYSSIGFKRLTATSRMRLRRNNILPGKNGIVRVDGSFIPPATGKDSSREICF